MLVRPAHDADFPAIAALTNRYITGTSTHFGYTPVTAEELRAGWVASRERYPYLVAQLDALPNGFAGYAKASRWRDRDAYAWTAEVGIYVVDSAHGQGVGKALYRALIDHCRRCGFHTLVGGVTLPNEASVRLHESCGFRQVGVFRDAGWKLDAWHSVAWFQLELATARDPATPLRPPGA